MNAITAIFCALIAGIAFWALIAAIFGVYITAGLFFVTLGFVALIAGTDVQHQEGQ